MTKEYNKIILSKPLKTSLYKKVVIKRMLGARYTYQAEQFTETQVVHTNFDDLILFVCETAKSFKELYLFGEESYSAFLKNGQITLAKKIKSETSVPSTHNKEKNYLIKEGTPLPIFVKLGIFTKDYKIVAQKQDKFRQINRYLELLDDCLKDYNQGDKLYAVDFGSGKSYLSFATYYYFKYVKKVDIFMSCVDLKTDVINDCRKLANEYGYTDMEFVAGDIKDFVAKNPIDLVISLHACDVATDYVLEQAVERGVKHIFSVPCCQKELNKNINNAYEPILLRYGILQERISALLTDAIRATVLELKGYKTEIIEFVDLADSPKNLLIRASKSTHSPSYLSKKQEELNDLLTRLNFVPTIVRLLLESK